MPWRVPKARTSIAIEPHLVAGPEHVPLHGKAHGRGREVLDDVNDLVEAGRAVEGEGLGAAVEREGLDQPEEAEVVVRVPVGDEDCVDREPCLRPHHLLLRALAAVEEERVGSPADEEAGRVPEHGRERAGRPQEVHLEGLARYRSHPLMRSSDRRPSSTLRPSTTAIPS